MFIKMCNDNKTIYEVFKCLLAPPTLVIFPFHWLKGMCPQEQQEVYSPSVVRIFREIFKKFLRKF